MTKKPKSPPILKSDPEYVSFTRSLESILREANVLTISLAEGLSGLSSTIGNNRFLQIRNRRALVNAAGALGDLERTLQDDYGLSLRPLEMRPPKRLWTHTVFQEQVQPVGRMVWDTLVELNPDWFGWTSLGFTEGTIAWKDFCALANWPVVARLPGWYENLLYAANRHRKWLGEQEFSWEHGAEQRAFLRGLTGWPDAIVAGTSFPAGKRLGAPPRTSENQLPMIGSALQEFTLSEARVAFLDRIISAVNTRTNEDQTPPKRAAVRRQPASSGAREKLIAALTKHHQYADGGALNLKPIGNNQLATMAQVSNKTASKFFASEFGGHGKYVFRCRDVSNLVKSLKILNGEYTPKLHFGGEPTPKRRRPDDGE